jgi:hypothetical protein
MEPITTYEEFHQRLSADFAKFSREAWTRLVEHAPTQRPDRWMRAEGGRLLRQTLGLTLQARAERLGSEGPCVCGGELVFRQHRKSRVHTVLPGRDVDTVLRYSQCSTCGSGAIPLLRELATDPEGFTPELRELALLAAVIEPYEPAATQLLGKFALVEVCREKLRALVTEHGAKAEQFLGRTAPRDDEKILAAQVYAEIDGGMIHVDGSWQECKLATLFRDDERVEISEERHELLAKEMIGVRGPPEGAGEAATPACRRRSQSERF